MRYYSNIREQEEFKIDQSKLQEYFPLNVVLDGTFKIYQSLLGLVFEEVNDDEPLHHPEAKLVMIFASDFFVPKVKSLMIHFIIIKYRVLDSESKKVIGHFYTDLHPRDGKYGHAAVFPLRV